MTVSARSDDGEAWDWLGSVPYRRQTLYTLTGTAWSTLTRELDDSPSWRLSLGASGGALACAYLAGHVATAAAAVPVQRAHWRESIFVLSPAGALVSQLALSPSTTTTTTTSVSLSGGGGTAARAIAIGWTTHEHLVCVYDDATVLLHSVLDGIATQAATAATGKRLSLGAEAQSNGVLDARFIGPASQHAGMLVLTNTLRLVQVCGWPDDAQEEEDESEEEDEDVEASKHAAAAAASGGEQTTNTRRRSSKHGKITEWPALTGLSSSPPTAWCTLGTGKRLEALLATNEGTLIRADEIDSQEQRLPGGLSLVCRHLEPSPDGRFIALVGTLKDVSSASSTPQLIVTTSDLARVLCQISLSRPTPSDDDDLNGGEREQADRGEMPSQLAWCASNAVVVNWRSHVQLFAPDGRSVTYSYAASDSTSSGAFVAAEHDGARVFSGTKAEFIERVPLATQASFASDRADSAPGDDEELAPARRLLEAHTFFLNRLPRSHEIVRELSREGTLSDAVNVLVAAAAHEFAPAKQRHLLRAATFGKTFIDAFDARRLVSVANYLRALNAARSYDVALAISYDEFIGAGAPGVRRSSGAVLVKRLVRRSQHALALKLAEHLRAPRAPVLRHWAQSLIASHAPSARDKMLASRENDELCRRITKRLQVPPPPGALPIRNDEVACADVARYAWEAGHKPLALLLLEHERKAARQVPLLLTMGEQNAALNKAISVSDPDLIHSVLAHLRRAHSLGQFLRFVDNRPLAATMLVADARRMGDLELVRAFYYQDDRRTESACLALEEAGNAKDFDGKVAKVRQASKHFNEDKDRVFEAKMMDDYAKLLHFQKKLDDEHPATSAAAAAAGAGPASMAVVGASVHETLRQCILRGQPKKADELKKDLKVSDERFWYVKMRALIEQRDWEALEAFARSKKSPIGYEPFVSALLAASHKTQALRYVARCEGGKTRVELFVKCGKWHMAADECLRTHNREELVELFRRAPNAELAAEMEERIHELDRRP